MLLSSGDPILRFLLYHLVPGRHARSKELTMPHLHIVSIEKEFTLDQQSRNLKSELLFILSNAETVIVIWGRKSSLTNIH